MASADYHRPYDRHSGFGRVEDQVRNFWRRVSDGLEIQQLWGQFKADARSGYNLYSKEVDWEPVAGETPGRRYWRIAKTLFWAMVMKLSPARRVMLILALALVVLGMLGTEVRVSDKTVISIGNGWAILGALALLLLLALELADRVTMKRDLEIAKEIQQWLVPETPPIIPGAEIAFASRAANTVAGDYYDALLRSGPNGTRVPAPEVPGGTPENPDSRRLLIVVADVAGKSVPAALLMATLQASLRTLALSPGSVTELVAGLNAYACEISQAGRRFTTAFLAEFDLATHNLTYVNAGHNQPMLLRGPGAAGGPTALDRLAAGGLPLGIMRNARYEAGEVALHSGDRLVIFTDGVVEAEDESAQEFGEGRLLAELQMGRSNSASDALKGLMASVDTFVGHAPQHDDITCLIFDCK
jgi:sigma-B regulation protein RsbU (phosphoserine phosphatase)